MDEIGRDIIMIDTLLGGIPRVTAAYLVPGRDAALVDTGARTSAQAVRAELSAAGLGPGDLRWIVLTHVHLDHCGGTGILAGAFPEATVVVHRRGARHLVEPGRLLAGSAAVYGSRWSLYGGLDPTPPERILAVEDGHRVALGAGRFLTMIETPGHARHHMSVLEEDSGALMAGDALGVRFPGSGLFPALPPPDIDLDAADVSLARLAERGPARLFLSHYGPVDEPVGAIALARGQLALLRDASEGSSRSTLAARVERRIPFESTVGDPLAIALWRRLGWAEANIEGLAGWIGAGAGDRSEGG